MQVKRRGACSRPKGSPSVQYLSCICRSSASAEPRKPKDLQHFKERVQVGSDQPREHEVETSAKRRCDTTLLAKYWKNDKKCFDQTAQPKVLDQINMEEKQDYEKEKKRKKESKSRLLIDNPQTNFNHHVLFIKTCRRKIIHLLLHKSWSTIRLHWDWPKHPKGGSRFRNSRHL